MKSRPAVDEAALRMEVHNQYGLRTVDLSFLPVGQNSSAYVAAADDGRRYLLKLFGPHPLGWSGPAHLDYYLELTCILSERDYPARVVAPVPTVTGRLWTWWDSAPGAPSALRLALYPFIEGRAAGSDWRASDHTLKAVAQTLGRMHRDTDDLRARVPALVRHAESFDVSFERELLANVATLEHQAAPPGPVVEELRRRLLPERGRILAYLQRARELSSLARAAYISADRMVLCHTDVNPFNLLIGRDGEVYLLDWEGAKLAPPEQDLRCLLGADAARNALALTWYAGEFGPVLPNADVLAFYEYRWPLFELAYYTSRILADETSEEQRRSDLQEIEEDVLSWWDELPAQVVQLSRF